MKIQSILIIRIILQLAIPVTLLCGSTVHWLKMRRISSIGMTVGAILVLVAEIFSAMYHPLSPLGRELSIQEYSEIAIRLRILSGIAWLTFGGNFIWMAFASERRDTKQSPAGSAPPSPSTSTLEQE